MCGIVGVRVLEETSFRVEEDYLARMRDAMIHRGPDGSGMWISSDRRVGLGHRRLSIIDLSTSASQPMANEDGSIWVTFNGEIYNHSEIRHELNRLGGHQWKTDHSDTEVIVHAYEQWGIDCLDRFRGMFAIGIWDGRTRELWLVRDRLGIKPLYYSIHHGRLAFASEIKALLKDPEQKRAIHEESLFHYLSFLTTPAPQTLFDGIKKVPAGCLVHVDAQGRVTERRYWEVWGHVTPLIGLSDEELSERILAELRVSVRLHAESDVPVGVFLSGGIDSSTNAALFSETQPGRVKAFTIGYQGEYTSYRNEISYARRMADHIGAEYHERLLNVDDLLAFLPEMVRLQDEPIADPVCIPVYYVSKLARDNGAVVAQVGEGADELFWGYPYWKLMRRLALMNQWPVPRVLKQWGLYALSLVGKGDSEPYEWLRRGAMGQPVFWGGAEAFTQSLKFGMLSPGMQRRFKDYSSWEVIRPIHDRFVENAWQQTPHAWMAFLDMNLRLPELLLMRVDKMAMGVGLEARVPFLDHKLVELALGIPESAITRNGNLKQLLKRAVRGVIPDELIDRRKQGFGVPIHEWHSALISNLPGSLNEPSPPLSNLLNYKTVAKPRGRDESNRAWYLLNLSLWCKEYIT